MSEIATVKEHAVLTEQATLEIQRLLPGPVERIWDYLTRSELRRQWLVAGEMPMAVGAAFELVWRNDELSERRGPRPPEMREEERMSSRITELDPPHRLSFTWEGSGDVTIQLEPQGDEVLLTVTHRRVPDRDTLLSVSAGWHTHLDMLATRLAGGEPEPFWNTWSRLHREYGARMPG